MTTTDIARDALKHLEAGKISPHRGLVLDMLSPPVLDMLSPPPHPFDLRQHLKGLRGACSACLKGGLLYAKVMHRRRPFEVENYDLGSETIGRLLPEFSTEQLALIETAFECNSFIWNRMRLSEGQIEQAIAYGERYPYTAERFRAILENIIAHDGVFVPEVEVPA